MASKVYSVGVIGHRDLGGCDSYDYAHLVIHKLLRELKRTKNEVKAISAISEGADSLFAKSAISLDIKLESIIPFEGFSSDFYLEESRERYKSIRKASDKESRVKFKNRNNLAYRKSMEWIVFKSNTIIALWDGNEIGTVGGTWEAVSLCKKLKKNMIHIDTMKRITNIYAYKGNKYSMIRDVNSNTILRYI